MQLSVARSRLLTIRPTKGMWQFDPGEDIPEGASPDMQNFQLYQGYLRKRPGYAQFPSGGAALGTSIIGLYSTKDESNNERFFAVHETGVARWNSGTSVWDASAGPALTSGADKLVSFDTSQNCMVFANGVDQVMSCPLGANVYAILNANCPPAKYLTRFADRLYLGFTVEAGNQKPFRTRWSVNSDHTDWLGTGSGFRDNSEQPYYIKNLKKLGNFMVQYTEQSVWHAQRTGAAIGPAQFQLIVESIGLYAGFTLASFRELHIYLGNDDFYLFDGSAPVPIGPPIRDKVFGNLNPSVLDKDFGIITPDTQEYLCFIATGNSVVIDTAWIYNYGRNAWYPWKVSGPKCAALHRLDSALTIAQLVGAISAQNWAFDSRYFLSAYPALMTGHTDGKIYNWSPVYTSDNGTAIDCYWTSKDITAKDVDPSFNRHYVKIKKIGIAYVDSGQPVTLACSYSVDGGINWSTPENITFGGVYGNINGDVTWFKQITDKNIRVKFRNNTTTDYPIFIEFTFDLEVDEQTF